MLTIANVTIYIYVGCWYGRRSGERLNKLAVDSLDVAMYKINCRCNIAAHRQNAISSSRP